MWTVEFDQKLITYKTHLKSHAAEGNDGHREKRKNNYTA
jgi:hypothetical protein